MVNIPLVLIIDRTLRDAGIPIDGVSVGTPADRSTWAASYAASATLAQIAAGNALLLSLDPTDAATVSAVRNDLAAGLNTEMLQAVALALWEAIPAPTMTRAQLKARIVAIYRTL